MADTIKIGSLDISAFKVGSSDCKLYLGNTKLYPNVDYSNCFKFVATNSGTFTFNGNDIDYSLDSGATWTTLSNGTATPTITAGSSILWKASGLTPTSSIGIGTFSSTANFTAEGNVMSLLYGDNFEGQTSLSGKDHAYRTLFSGCTTLTSIDNMSLPATTLSTQCYRNMFGGTKITSIPSDLLPATTLATQCYMNMFIGCSNLTDVSNLKLPSTTLANTCYQGMFAQCANLERTPTLSAATLVKECYMYMYQSSPKINYIKCLAKNISASNCTLYWVTGVAASGTFYKASSMNNWARGSSGIPSGWTVQNA